MPYEEEHANPQGPGDSRPNAMQIIEDEGLTGKLSDRVVIITGASSGIGVEDARALYANGATVYMPVRNVEKGGKVAEDIKSTETNTPGRLEVMPMDLGSLDSVQAFAKAFLEKESKLNLLINNAGVLLTSAFYAFVMKMDPGPQATNAPHAQLRHHVLLQILNCPRGTAASQPPVFFPNTTGRENVLREVESVVLNRAVMLAGIMACPESTTTDGFEAQFGTNHVAHFLLFELLRPLLLSSSTPELNSRVVALSSTGHRAAPVFFDDLDLKKQGYNPWVAYGQSKTANILMAIEIERKYGSDGLHASAVMPGGIMTGLQTHVDEGMRAMWEQPEIKKFMKNTEQGAATTMWAAVGKEWEGKGGKYLDDCAVAGEAPEDAQMLDSGHSKWAMDPEAAEKLWEVSLELTKPWREVA